MAEWHVASVNRAEIFMTMKKQEIINSNKLIAEFMYPEAKQEYKDGEMQIRDGLAAKAMFIFGHFEYMKYSSSWDWLMPVVEKIEDTPHKNRYSDVTGNYNCEIKGTLCIIQNLTDNLYHGVACSMGKKIDAVYGAVVEFIKWYNENK